ncbi:MAG: tetratricopeptide repeat protein, partial [Cyanobacteria bacterium J06588_5]
EILRKRGETTAALNHFEQAVESNPSLSPAQAALGELLLEREQYLRAVLAYRQLTRTFPEDEGVRYNLGLALWGQGNSRAAIEALERSLRLYERQDDSIGAERATALLEVWRNN